LEGGVLVPIQALLLEARLKDAAPEDDEGDAS